MSHKQSFSYIGKGLLGSTSTKLELMCLAQGHYAVTPVRLEPAASGSQVKHSSTEPLRSLHQSVKQFESQLGPICRA